LGLLSDYFFPPQILWPELARPLSGSHFRGSGRSAALNSQVAMVAMVAMSLVDWIVDGAALDRGNIMIIMNNQEISKYIKIRTANCG